MRSTVCAAFFYAQLFCALGCGTAGIGSSNRAQSPSAHPSVKENAASPPAETGGVDGQQAFAFTAKLVSFGPRPPDSEGIHRAQDFILSQLRGDGCRVDVDDFHASTPVGIVPMKNIVAQAPGRGKGVILLLTHYDTLRMPNFVGAVDGGSSTGLMLEVARLLCRRKQPAAVWIGFLDGEEAFVQWSDTDSTYGSRELAARLALSGELRRVKAVILADMVGPKNLQILRETNSTRWLTDLVWDIASKLGYQKYFLSDSVAIQDDHLPFLRRGVPAVDIIDLIDYQRRGYWHTPQDTLDKVSARSLAVVGHVVLETVKELEARFGH